MSDPKPIVFVAGLARCGTSLTMQMLHAAGLPCVGEWPSFEVDDANHRPLSPAFMQASAGHAVKWLDPHMAPPAIDAPWLTIWLDRDPTEQAKSQAKFTAAFFPAAAVGRSGIRRLASGLKRDRAKALAMISQRPRLFMTFETIVTDPRASAHRIASWLQPWFGDLDYLKMASVVFPRGSRCQPGLDIELKLIDRAEARP